MSSLFDMLDDDSRERLAGFLTGPETGRPPADATPYGGPPELKFAPSIVARNMFWGGAGAGALAGAGFPHGPLGLPASVAQRVALGSAGALAGGLTAFGASRFLPNKGRSDEIVATDHLPYERSPQVNTREINGFANTAGDASELDYQVGMEKWMRENPGASAAYAAGQGAVDGVGGGSVRELFNPSITSRMRANHPYAYRGGQWSGIGGMTALNPWVGAGLGLQALLGEAQRYAD
jgi:hypothetical protein